MAIYEHLDVFISYIVQVEHPFSMAEYPIFEKHIKTTHNSKFKKVPRST